MQHLFLDSSKGSQVSDKPWQWTANLEPGLIQCDPATEYLTLTLERFTCVTDWDWIPPDTRFTVAAADDSVLPVHEFTVTLPRGNPRLSRVAEAVGASAPAVKCTYDASSNRFRFESEFGLQLRFPSIQVASLLGFTTLTVGPAQALESKRAIRPLPIDTIAVHVLGPSVPKGNLTNMALGEHAGPSQILGVIPVTASPYTVLDWVNPSGAFTVKLADKKLNSLTFLLTDWAGNKLTSLGQHFVCLRVDTRKHETHR